MNWTKGGGAVGRKGRALPPSPLVVLEWSRLEQWVNLNREEERGGRGPYRPELK